MITKSMCTSNSERCSVPSHMIDDDKSSIDFESQLYWVGSRIPRVDPNLGSKLRDRDTENGVKKEIKTRRSGRESRVPNTLQHSRRTPYTKTLDRFRLF